MDKYRILCNERVIYNNLSEEDMFEVMDELSQQYYETGVPKPDDLVVECLRT
jgi:hypothetical protein